MSSHSEPTTTQVGAHSIDFFSLPREVRQIIYERVLSVPFVLHIFQDPGCSVELFAPRKPYAWLSLLYVNRLVSEEARSAFYGTNWVTFMEVEKIQPPGTLLKSFLKTIGPVNGSFLSRIAINFPATEIIEGYPEIIEIRKETLQSLRLLQKGFVGLKTIELLIFNRTTRRLVEEDQIIHASARNALLKINVELRAIPSLNTIAVRYTSGSPGPSAKAFLEKLQWSVLFGDR
ncbi:hypothetical protein N7456_010080 [Penicillium angulare]|uniref:Uncharacterized protein n=1 Tax=Penicillium angulare TaxID=116970 RepID=A0A9W9F653_9EURO|nr:hypothetical protein N7456_010080 [Penicillium angulare]